MDELLYHVVNAEGFLNTSYVSKGRAEQIVENLREYAPEQTFRAVVADDQPGDYAEVARIADDHNISMNEAKRVLDCRREFERRKPEILARKAASDVR
jgi:hypothetical protein